LIPELLTAIERLEAMSDALNRLKKVHPIDITITLEAYIVGRPDSDIPRPTFEPAMLRRLADLDARLQFDIRLLEPDSAPPLNGHHD
jgi:hypothetical protein